jgi:hypothetical protein
MCVCVCVCEREREREIIYIYMYIYIYHGISVNSFTVHFGWIIGYLFIRAIYIEREYGFVSKDVTTKCFI